MLKVKKDDVRTIPVWVRFYNIPLELWDEEDLSQISSKVGKPLYIDYNFLRFHMLAFA